MEDRTKMALTALRQILRSTEHNAKAVMRDTGLTPSQLVFMQLLDETGEETAGHVASRMGITQATATVLIQKLESAGMVVRRKGEQDRRQSWMSLTAKGRDVLEIAPNSTHARFHQQFTDLQGWEQLMVIAALEKVASMLHTTETEAKADSQML